MNRLNSSKLNHLMGHWPLGIPLTSDWLNCNGYYKQLVNLYCKNGWIKSLGRGVYTRLNDPITWQGAVNAIQTQLHLPVHIGGLTALQIYGVTQYIMLNNLEPTFYLYHSNKKTPKLPMWFQKKFTHCHWEQKLLFKTEIGLGNKEVEGIQIKLSSPERAILEVLSIVPNKVTLTHVNELMESLDRLRSDVMQELLESCLSIKVKRLFLYFAEKCNLACFNELELSRIDIGAGKRVIDSGGRYHKKWLLSLPENKSDDEITRE
ncbi:MAG: type IV toxin-antitoxin system AbiEi family antitoxin domain-containing protein [Gammaproteobacteria bacterium]|nr:type IV toxin-antitoxin system AbiEi family antitoxin domain-containing protein [Gammaproteobacteria bacterium]